MFHSDPPAPDALGLPETLDFGLPDALRRARHAALLALNPALAARGWTEPKFLLLRALAGAGEPLSQTEAAARAGLILGAGLHAHIRRLVADGYVVWVSRQKTFAYSKLSAHDIGRRQINHIDRELVRGGARNWADLAALPPDVRITERMCARLFALMDKLAHACDGANMESGANAPAGLPEPGDLAAVTLPLQARRARSALVKRIARILAQYDLSEAHWRILRILGEQPGLGWTRRGIERRGCFSFSDPTVQRGLAYLNERGLVRRQVPDTRPSDWHRRNGRKRWRVEIARAGLAMIARVEDKERGLCRDVLAAMNAREMWQLQKLLARTTAALLWRADAADDEQDTHPLAGRYRHFDAYVFAAARAFEMESRILKEAGLPVPKRTRRQRWWD
jgi:DNA-binding MarR family transcriptional regulator